mmetsp:Transcript_28402/g.90883  ORF Transcript_28402/g.90883 Transcript_28402/m.90883 type:complete len:123 (+) Transcript_28402:247-615(+)
MRHRGNDNMAYRGGYGGGRGGGQQDTSQNLMELENNRRIGLLGDQVAQLKAISLDIHDEVEAQTGLLENMDQQFGNTGDMLNKTMEKLAVMLKTGNKKHMLYLIAFVVGTFLIIWFMMKTRK